jgi:enamine deaminase RidA (YjgF/YER057c/UK114 family)
MYQFSRSIYRDLAPRIDTSEGVERTFAARQKLLEACESTIQRLVSDRRYFARPAKTLFTEVRDHFALAEQVRVYMVIERHIERIEEFLDSLPADVTLDGQERNCLASTRKGTPCQREPLPGMDYCPSHKHLEETEEVFAAREIEAAAA